ncbi:T6SS immunity protein Tdi1 domain-containing protein [Mumia sp. DW29H23]|uniref:T6SS immunity protein Tdi1 domain-containing protein n=1 Tax=Mumia sp. DW29H23 TaxID=3421241 RepID=UPI003D698479
MTPDLARSDDPGAAERDLDLAWELFGAQPTHPKVAELALRVLAVQPERSSASLLLGNHREACGATDEARRLYLRVAGRRDSQFINAARAVRHLAAAEHDYPEALQWARTVLGESQEEWDDWMELGSALAFSGEHDDGWHQLDEAVALCARTAPDELSTALGLRAVYLLGSFAPPDRFVPAAEEAIRADAADSWVSVMLGWAYLVQYRFADAEQLARRLLREDPTEGQFQYLLGTAQTMQRIVENADAQGYSMEDVRRTGVLEMTWQQLRDRELGIDLRSALAALEDAMPADLRATLAPGASFADEADMPGAMAADDLVTWHDGQRPGTGSTWRQPEPFRLMSAAEIRAMTSAIEADPAAYPDWPENDAWEPVLTDDAGAYLVVVAFGALVKRRSGQPDEPVAASMAGWIWDRVADFGGRDPRPQPRTVAADSSGVEGSGDGDRIFGITDFVPHAPVEREVVASFRGRVPDELVAMWEQYGYGTFADGFLRIINPSEYLTAVGDCIGKTQGDGIAIPIMVTGLGDLITWEPSVGVVGILFREGRTVGLGTTMRTFVRLTVLDGAEELSETFNWDLFPQATAAHGDLPYDRSFIFVPLLSLGGSATVENLHMRDTITAIRTMVELQGVIGH